MWSFVQKFADVFQDPSADPLRYINSSISNEYLITHLKKKAHDEFSTPYNEKQGLKIRKINMKLDDKNEKHMIQKYSLGHETNKPNKIIMFVGATGAGKTTLINNMVNFIFRVNFDDNFRFILIDDKDAPEKSQAHSQTDIITAYSFNHIDGMPFEYNYVLVDTPGFGDTRGITRDREMMKQLEEFLKQRYGIDSVHAVGFVIPASLPRLTATQLYVFEGLLSMFGVDIKDNIYVQATFSDGRPAPVLEALKEANVQYKDFYKFNNSALYANNKLSETGDKESDMERNICSLYWDMGYKNMKEFFLKLGSIIPASLTLTKEVLKERASLQLAGIGLQNQISFGMGKLSVLQQEQSMLDRLSEDIDECEKYETEVDVTTIIKIDLNQGEYVTNCVECNITCHYPCDIPEDANKGKCDVMSGGFCTVCLGKCSWNIHRNMNFRIKPTIIKENRTLQQLKDRYNTARCGQLTKENMIKAMEEEIKDCSVTIITMIQLAQKSILRLEEIALKPNPLSTTEYIDVMIESEKMQKKTDFQRRINVLEKLKQESNILQGMKGTDLKDKEGVELLKDIQKMMISDKQ